jgi:hypothetical protein
MFEAKLGPASKFNNFTPKICYFKIEIDRTPKCNGPSKVQWSRLSVMVTPTCDGLRQSAMIY